MSSNRLFLKSKSFDPDHLPDSEETKCDSLEEVPVPKFLKLNRADILLETIVYCKQPLWLLKQRFEEELQTPSDFKNMSHLEFSSVKYFKIY